MVVNRDILLDQIAVNFDGPAVRGDPAAQRSGDGP